jgi:SmpA/OmlA family protein
MTSNNGTLRYSLRQLLIIITFIGVSIAFTRFAVIACLGPAIPHATLRQLKVGMPQTEVKKILGSPNVVNDEFNWSYRPLANPGWVDVHFNASGGLEWINDESIQVPGWYGQFNLDDSHNSK